MGNRTSVNQNIFSSIGFLNIENRVRQLRLNHVHNFFYNKINPHYIKENFSKVRDCYHHLTRSREYNFFVPPVKGQQFQTFYYNGIKDWNILPVSLKCIRNSEAFKSGVKDFLPKNSIRESSDGFIFY